MHLDQAVVIVTGASRGIGREIALRVARAGARVVLAAKSDAPHPKLPGTIHSVAEEARALGAQALPLRVDVRDEAQVAGMVEAAADTFGRVDGLVNNAGAIRLEPTESLDVKRLDLMLAINLRAALVCAKYCIPHMRRAGAAHILNLSPPLNLGPRWFRAHAPYTVSKYGMTLATLGLAAELADSGIAVNSLWPKTTIATAAIEFNPGMPALDACRTPAIMAEAAYEILRTPPAELTARTLVDEAFLRERGYRDFERFAVRPGAELAADLFIDDPPAIAD